MDVASQKQVAAAQPSGISKIVPVPSERSERCPVVGAVGHGHGHVWLRRSRAVKLPRHPGRRRLRPPSTRTEIAIGSGRGAFRFAMRVGRNGVRRSSGRAEGGLTVLTPGRRSRNEACKGVQVVRGRSVDGGRKRSIAGLARLLGCDRGVLRSEARGDGRRKRWTPDLFSCSGATTTVSGAMGRPARGTSRSGAPSGPETGTEAIETPADGRRAETARRVRKDREERRS